MNRSIKLSLAALAFVATAGTAQAQSGNVTAEATVLSPLTLTPIRTLQFGNTFPGVLRTVAATDAANSGAIQVIGSGTSQVAVSAPSMTVTLACVGTCTGGVATPITLNVSASALAGGIDATPANSTAFTLGTAGANRNLVGGNLFVLIGGSLTPAANQAAGLYRGTIQINAAYTGL
jgi:hypothetical protein